MSFVLFRLIVPCFYLILKPSACEDNELHKITALYIVFTYMRKVHNLYIDCALLSSLNEQVC